ncbi:MAG: SRPBCC family protein [Acidobacteria bacterium]|nr:SRPBCC family protein [Acidobacteriota bacterium]MCB9397554.1 SRPBCC family protein [Acidobacteriota bacterium]
MDVLAFEQWIDQPVSRVWSYFCDEYNLSELTPPWLGFEVLGKTTPQIDAGTEIEYRIRLYGIPLRWVSVIKRWEPGVQFMDVQKKGPYAVWEHLHYFEDHGPRTLMKDHILFKPRFGLFGTLAKPWVREQVKRIFAYRYEVIEQRFNRSRPKRALVLPANSPT